MQLRIAEYNVENLFERAKILNMPLEEGRVPLQQLAELRQELKRNAYDAAKILPLAKSLAPYIEICEDRGKLFKRSGMSIAGLAAAGPSDWDGGIALKMDAFTEETRGNTAKVIREMDADIVSLIEVESLDTLRQFNSDLLKRAAVADRYAYALLLRGNDPRSIDVGLLSRFPLGDTQTHIFDKGANGRSIFSRDCMVFRVTLPDGRILTMLVNHFKSKGYGNQVSNTAKRKAQAERVAQILKGYDLRRDLVAVTMDANDVPDSVALEPLLSVPNLYDVLALQFPANKKSRWTYHYRAYEQIDYILVSEPLRAGFRSARVERRGMYGIKPTAPDWQKSFGTVTSESNAASDHAGVVAEFQI